MKNLIMNKKKHCVNLPLVSVLLTLYINLTLIHKSTPFFRVNLWVSLGEIGGKRCRCSTIQYD